MNWISIIPVRAGSKGLTNKNIRSVCGKPLYRYTVDFALNAGAKKIFISTDIEEILSLTPEENIVITKRNKKLCQDHTKMSSVILNFLQSEEGIKIDDDQTIVLLQATSPLRKQSDVQKGLSIFTESKDLDLLMGVTEADNGALKYGFVNDKTFKHISDPNLCFENRQNLPKLYKPSGSFYIFKAGWFRANKTFATNATGAIIISSEYAIDIDQLEDIEHFERVLKDGKGLK